MSEKKKREIRRGVQPFEEQLDREGAIYEKRLKNLEKGRARKQEMIENGELNEKGHKHKPAPKTRRKPKKKKQTFMSAIREVAGIAPTERVKGSATAEDIKDVIRYLYECPREELDAMERNPKMPMYGIVFIRAIKKDAVMGSLKNYSWLYENILKEETTNNTGEVVFQSSFIQADDIEYVEEETDSNE